MSLADSTALPPFAPRLPVSDRILVRDLRCRGIVGILPHERTTPQEIVVNLVLHADTRPAADSGDIAAAVDYDRVSRGVVALVEASDFQLVERLADRIATLCLEQPLVERVEVTVEKPEALPFTKTVGVSVDRTRDEPSE